MTATMDHHIRLNRTPFRITPPAYKSILALSGHLFCPRSAVLPLYQADLSAGSLMLPESRVLARLLAHGVSGAAFDHAVRIDNVLQKKAPATAIRQARLIRLRLHSIAAEAWPLIADGDKELSSQLLFAAALKHSALLTDFVRNVVAGDVRRLESKLSLRGWAPFLADCATREPAVATWVAATRVKLLQVILRMLVEARYLDGSSSLNLLPPHISPVVRRLLIHSGELNLLRTMELQA